MRSPLKLNWLAQPIIDNQLIPSRPLLRVPFPVEVAPMQLS